MAEPDYVAAGEATYESATEASQGNYAAAANAALRAADEAGLTGSKAADAVICMGGSLAASFAGAAAGVAAGAALGPVGSVVGGLIGAFSALISSAEACAPPWPEVYFNKFMHDDVGFSVVRFGKNWTPNKNAEEKAFDKYTVGPRGLTLGTVLHLMRRARELGGGVQDVRRIMVIVTPDAEVDKNLAPQYRAAARSVPTLEFINELKRSKAWKRIGYSLELQQMADSAMVRGGWDRPSVEMWANGYWQRMEGEPTDQTAAEYAELQRLLANYEATYYPTYAGKLRNILPQPKYTAKLPDIRKAIASAARRRAKISLEALARRRRAAAAVGAGQTRGLDLGDSSAFPFLLLGAGLLAWYFFKGRK